ncbi:hypothetical protein FPANT_8350 [Fusarium pseudoanthophilum]|uniref:DUF7908 domain-containing protein n=1 Tax=Fusarium pseudoanthophilum TaxID=48495 RepID=A0A8H5NZS0_9HYPO|nr:hypothetical protein FPANT_8350 [Fusarium pseudoanthophilum]
MNATLENESIVLRSGSEESKGVEITYTIVKPFGLLSPDTVTAEIANITLETRRTWRIELGSFKEVLVREKDAVAKTYASILIKSEAAQDSQRQDPKSVVLLRAVAASSETDLAPREAETYCVTYLSTYLAAIPNNEVPFSSIDDESDTDDRETGRFPLVPSIRPTFGRNTSIATTSTNPRTSQIEGETSQLAEFVSGSLSQDLPLSSDDAPTTPSAFQTTFGQTTLAAPTTTGLAEPEGQTVIFLIQLPDDDRKRNIDKRAVGGFVGDGSPDTCTFAASFNLAEGQLFKNGNPTFYSGEDFKELDSQGSPPADAITKGFTSTGTSLSFQNDDLPNGEAGFCQTSDGQVYITFTSAPPGCTPVTLGVYDGTLLRYLEGFVADVLSVSRCQNGKLVGVDDLVSSASSMSVTQESSIVSEEATGLSSEPAEPSTSSFGVTTLQPSVISSSETPSSIEGVASTTSLEIDDSISQSSVVSIPGSSSSELADSTTISDLASTTLATLEASSERTTAESADGTTVKTIENEETMEVSTTADETSELAESTTLLTLESSSEEAATDSADDTTLETTSNEATTEVSTTADETTAQTTTTVEIPTTTVDACVAGITSMGGLPPLQDRIDDCEDFNVVTVSPYTVTVTINKKRWEYRIPTGWPTARPTNRQLVRRQDPDATTIFPTETPAYATYCDSAEEYYDACSSAGVNAMTTTLPTPTESETDEEPACRAASLVKRAGEGLGYQFEDDWDVIRMPGWRYPNTIYLS